MTTASNSMADIQLHHIMNTLSNPKQKMFRHDCDENPGKCSIPCPEVVYSAVSTPKFPSKSPMRNVLVRTST